jgi:uncharacterized membrane protein
MSFNILIWACIIWIVPLICYMLLNETKFKKNIVIGVTLPFEAREDDHVLAILKRYRKQQIGMCIFLLVIVIPCLFVKNIFITMTLWGIWIDLCIVLPNVIYVINNGKLKKLKSEKGWKKAETGSVRVDLAAIPPDKWLSPWIFLPAVLLCLFPLIWDRDFWALYVLFAVCPVIFWLCHRYLYRNKSETIDGNTDLSRVLTQVRRHNWGKMWLASAYSFTAFSLVAFLTRHHPLWSIIMIIAVGFFISLAIIRVEMNTRKVQEKLTAQSGKDWYVDDDDKWIGGIIYCNPNDSRLIINNRIGTNSGINIAKPTGKILMGLVVLLIVAMPLAGALLGSIGEGEIVLELTETGIFSANGSTEYFVPYTDIAEIEHLEELPDNLVRTYGIGMDSLLRGNFSARGVGSIKVCLDPGDPPFILITTKGKKHYLFGTRDAGLTGQIYEDLSARLLQTAAPSP